MDQLDSVSVSGPSKIPRPESSKKMVFNAWGGGGITQGEGGGGDIFNASSDVSLFSTSLPLLPYEKVNTNGVSTDDSSSQSFDTVHDQEYKGKLLFEDIESAIGSLLPGDENELLAGIMDDFDLTDLPTRLEELEDDLFDSGGGMELDFETQDRLVGGLSRLILSDGNPNNNNNNNGTGHFGVPSSMCTIAGEHPFGEHPSRTLFVRNINSNVEDSELQSIFEQYGDIRTLYTACKHRGFVMISYYDIRDARNAMRGLQNKPLRRRKLDIHFSIPKDNPSEKDINQGTLVAFNLDASVSNDDLLQIFGAYGEVKEIRETPHKRHHKFIEFYDVRAAEAALKALNRSDIAGKRIKLEPSRPGGTRRSLIHQLSQDMEHDDVRFRQQVGSPLTVSPPGNWSHFGSPVDHNPLQGLNQSPNFGPLSPMQSNHLSGLATILSTQKVAPIGNKDQGQFCHANQVIGNSRLDPQLSLGESNSGIGMLSGPQFLWGTPSQYSSDCSNSSSAWETSSMMTRHQPFTSSGQGQVYSQNNLHGILSGLPHQHHYVGSAPHLGYFPESPEVSSVNRSSFSGLGINQKNRHYMLNHGFAHHQNINGSGSSSSKIMSFPSNGPLFYGNGPFQGIGSTNNDGLLDFGGSRRMEHNVNQMDIKKQYQLDLDKIKNGEDTRTTLMIKNIPNKYTSKMLLAAIDEQHSSTYDFLYLPIDFKNKCNVGYAFINIISPAHIIAFCEAFNGKKWEKFNSEKVASLAYARIQGKAALVSHFQNSSLMNEDKWCRPILFQSEGQVTDQEPPFNSNLNIFIRQPDGSYSGDSLEGPKSNIIAEEPIIRRI
ncbi:protein MEI2-like 5 [Impatiens glandulifera]|uniref:protein MEI2-like 5 n=1 Tax=Impatiens glandulifera TaxID=253017 RepID=UPI001FB0C911|nr:protein MEI2-like 5 [Impatiens glandulifera]